MPIKYNGAHVENGRGEPKRKKSEEEIHFMYDGADNNFSGRNTEYIRGSMYVQYTAVGDNSTCMRSGSRE